VNEARDANAQDDRRFYLPDLLRAACHFCDHLPDDAPLQDIVRRFPFTAAGRLAVPPHEAATYLRDLDKNRAPKGLPRRRSRDSRLPQRPPRLMRRVTPTRPVRGLVEMAFARSTVATPTIRGPCPRPRVWSKPQRHPRDGIRHPRLPKTTAKAQGQEKRGAGAHHARASPASTSSSESECDSGTERHGSRRKQRRTLSKNKHA